MCPSRVIAKIFKKADKKLSEAAASEAAELVLDSLAEARKKRWQLVAVVNTKEDQDVLSLKKTDFKSILAVFAAGKWVGYIKPGTPKVEVCIIGPLTK